MYVCACLCKQRKNDGKHHLTGSNKAALKEKSSQSLQTFELTESYLPKLQLPTHV